MATKLCPDPGMYQVIGSASSPYVNGALKGPSDGFKVERYIITNEEVYIEFVASEWKWTELKD